MYLGDGIIAIKGKDITVEESGCVRHDLEYASFVINIKNYSEKHQALQSGLAFRYAGA